MKKLASVLLCSTMALGLVGCGGSDTADAGSSDGGSTETEKATRIALIVPNIGDQSYFDTANHGLTLLEENYGDKVSTQLIEMGTDAGGWETAYRQAADEGYDYIISGNFMYESDMLKVAKEYPEIKWLNFDYGDAEANALDNVYAINYACQDAGYLAGVVAAVKSKSGVIGCIGGMETDGIKQFLAGYMEGAYDVNPDIKVVTGFVGNFTDTAKAKELALNMNKQGADVVYHAAGGAGNGMFEAAADADFWAIGVDSDQYGAMSGKPDLAKHILTSSEKKCDEGILLAITEMMEGKAEYGTAKTLTAQDGAVGLAENENYKANMSEDELAKVKEFQDKLLSGEKVVDDQLKDNTVYDKWLAKVGL